jgi:hypothetical protein
MNYTDNLPFLAGAGVVALLIWLFLKSKNKAPSQLSIPQFFFTKTGEFHIIMAEAVAGVMFTQHHGGQVENPAAVVMHRRGRLWFKPKEGADPNTYRRRTACYVTRQGDPSVLQLRHLFNASVPMSEVHTIADLEPVENLASEQAMAVAVQHNGSSDVIMRRMAILAGISVSLGGIAWIAVTLLAFSGAV